ncbi:protein phosphatase 2C domain-containing protein [Nocardia sp. NPDC051832]|uniref:PP2C family protein-serine/threonine phosphatase n=1 Tax=Nocardia sp. NPDC051832 TaxID=3155673 RepID=UPI0034478BF6
MIEVAAGSEVGNRYRANFDVVHLARSPLVAVVADGMGDGPGSARAGRVAVDTFAEWIGSAEVLDATVLRDAVALAQQRVGEIGRQLQSLAGCTLTALTESAAGFWITQIGDSRVYRLRDGLLELLTVDHTMAWLGAVHGWYPFESRAAAAARYHLTRYVGHGAHPEPDVFSVTVRAGDRYLVCSDGVAEQVRYEQIQDILGRNGSPESMVRLLLDAAEAAGGNDNATAIVVVAR